MKIVGTLLLAIAVLAITIQMASATDAPCASLGFDGERITVFLRNQDKEVVMIGNGTITTPDGVVTPFEIELIPLQENTWYFPFKKNGEVVLEVKYFLGEEGPHTLQLQRPVDVVSKPPQTTGFSGAVGAVAIFAIAIIRRNKK